MSKSIESIFNETELALFQRQTGFTFGKFYKTANDVLFAVDDQSGQVFIGSDLLKANVHELDSVLAVDRKEGCIVVTFKDSSTAKINAGMEDAEAFVAELGSIVQAVSPEDINEETRPQPEGQETIDESLPEPEYHRDGTMTGRAIFETVKRLKPGARIHLEFKPLIGKLRVCDAEYRKIKIDSASGVGNYFSLNEQAEDFQSLMNDVAEDLFDYIDLYFKCAENDSEISCHLRRVTMLKIKNESTAIEGV